MQVPLTTRKNSLLLLGSVFLVLTAVVLSYLYLKKNPQLLGYHTEQTQKEEPRDTRQELDVILADIKKVMLLTDSERPSLATVTEVEKMRSQSFFKNAENGDKVLIYEQGKKALLWRPSTKMIIEVGTVNKEIATAKNTDAPKVDAPKKVFIMIATEDQGFIQEKTAQLKKIPGITVISTQKADAISDLPSYVTDLTGTRTLETQLLAQTLAVKAARQSDTNAQYKGADFLLFLAQRP